MKINKINKKKTLIVLLVFLLFSFICECFIFNYRFWQSKNNICYERNVTPLGNDIIKNSDGTFTPLSNDTGLYYVSVNNVAKNLNNIYTDIHYINTSNDSATSFSQAVDETIYVIDDGHSSFYKLNSREIFSNEPISFYSTIHLYGNIHELMLELALIPDTNVAIEVKLNPNVPFKFNFERFFLLFSLILLTWILRPSSILYKIEYLEISSKTRKNIILSFFLFSSFIIVLLVSLNPYFHNDLESNYNQYSKLAESFSQGSLSLLEKPDQRLLNMNNPYNYMDRLKIFGNEGVFNEIRFDNAFYGGKYYVYFGVVPVILFYLPFYLITGHHIKNYIVCLFLICLFILSIILLVDELIKKYYRKCSLALWFLSIEFVLMGSYIFYAAIRPDHYNIPIVLGLSFSILGMWSFLKSFNESSTLLNKKYLVLAATFTALVAGCRPQLFLYFFIDIIILRKFIFSTKYLFSKDGVLSFLSVSIPMVIIAILLMTYNYMRFGSVINFGSTYNLTGEDLTLRGIVIERFIPGLNAMLFSPIRRISTYPFMDYYEVSTTYLGRITKCPTFGGIFSIFPVSLISIISLLYLRNHERNIEKSLIYISASSFAIVPVIICIDVSGAGIFNRYYMDFSTALSVSSVCTLWYILQKEIIFQNKRYISLLLCILMALFLLEILFILFVSTTDEAYIFYKYRPDLYYKYKYMFEFYL